MDISTMPKCWNCNHLILKPSRKNFDMGSHVKTSVFIPKLLGAAFSWCFCEINPDLTCLGNGDQVHKISTLNLHWPCLQTEQRRPHMRTALWGKRTVYKWPSTRFQCMWPAGGRRWGNYIFPLYVVLTYNIFISYSAWFTMFKEKLAYCFLIY